MFLSSADILRKRGKPLGLYLDHLMSFFPQSCRHEKSMTRTSHRTKAEKTVTVSQPANGKPPYRIHFFPVFQRVFVLVHVPTPVVFQKTTAGRQFDYTGVKAFKPVFSTRDTDSPLYVEAREFVLACVIGDEQFHILTLTWLYRNMLGNSKKPEVFSLNTMLVFHILPSSVIRHPSSVIRHPSSVIRHPSFLISHPSSVAWSPYGSNPSGRQIRV